MFRSRRFYLSLLAVVTCCTTAVNAVLSIVDAASLSAAGISLAVLATAASILDVVGLCCVAVFSLQCAWRKDGIVKGPAPVRLILCVSCAILSAVALSVSFASALTIKFHMEKSSSATPRTAISNWENHLVAQIAIWTLTCISQILLYSSQLWGRRVEEPKHPVNADPRDSVMSEVQHSNRTTNLFVLEPTQPISPLGALPSPTFSERSSRSIISWRDSLQHVVRPITSRTKLISRPSLTRDTRSLHSARPSIDTVSHSDGFDAWEVDAQARNAVLQLVPSRGIAMESIPGSRPASPVRASDGSYPMEADERTPPPLVQPPKMIPDTSRPPSPVVSEAHIHPLFRSESPTPPPTTFGTNILASPLSNQMIAVAARPYSRMRSNSRTASPSPLVHSRSLHDRTISPQGSDRSRSSSPPSREMTPPIPEFVLNSSPRSSMSGSQSRRKVNLQVDAFR
ncbi:hypothetical protein BDV95DRAFT_624730 [Massariosphaeria phaeospora]|uniref:Uncharacterized protein n=1 Tax=Massariosphaeria phaeospora TaxID=100035 RepID=A0A7C8MDY5_9PLEO|nr:hypothetical protein BDV95DRAFT_624730 [Massariosphaeria phaeospora]